MLFSFGYGLGVAKGCLVGPRGPEIILGSVYNSLPPLLVTRIDWIAVQYNKMSLLYRTFFKNKSYVSSRARRHTVVPYGMVATMMSSMNKCY